ncbi:SAM-dependent methyltransferase [Umezawaea endophytica]|uniref:SAM-dependent methyltransferase n=1 Tax=Umezawaea endophytica TaxID=1654476 RepID=A0A9X3A4B2_9PSEU|nr:SAM-dependent methyltransferase [Umezawaea endophytica]MCS7482654.1 SAM-dependent methyltransferase [Umezawaea endophytica]
MELWVPSSVDLSRPSVARMYDYFLGGSHNFAVDRETAKAIEKIYPGMAGAARANRNFLRRAVRYLCAQGVDQFLDLGSGIPTVGNVHEIAQQTNPAARVVYVDVEPVAVAHGNALLAGNDRAVAVRADLRDPDAVLATPEVRGVLDFDRPIAVLLASVLHFVPDGDDPHAAVARYRDAVCPGSYVALSHGSLEGMPQDSVTSGERVRAVYQRTDAQLVLRSTADITRFFDGLDLVEPGVVLLPEWRPDSDDAYISAYVGVGRKP